MKKVWPWVLPALFVLMAVVLVYRGTPKVSAEQAAQRKHLRDELGSVKHADLIVFNHGFDGSGNEQVCRVDFPIHRGLQMDCGAGYSALNYTLENLSAQSIGIVRSNDPHYADYAIKFVQQ